MTDFTFEWYSHIEIGIPTIDAQHQELFKIGRHIEELLLVPPYALEDQSLLLILCELRNYITYHFYEEEQLMQQVNYPELAPHKNSHAILQKAVNTIDCDTLRDSLADIKQLLEKWVFDHVLIEDHALGSFLKKL